MNSKERVIRAIEFNKPDRVPNGCYNLAVYPGERYNALKKIYNKYSSDFAEAYGMGRFIEWNQSYKKGVYKDLWGVVYKNLQNGIIGQPINHPLDSWDDLKTFEFPDPLSNYYRLESSIKKTNLSKYLLFDGGSIWQ